MSRARTDVQAVQRRAYLCIDKGFDPCIKSVCHEWVFASCGLSEGHVFVDLLCMALSERHTAADIVLTVDRSPGIKSCLLLE